MIIRTNFKFPKINVKMSIDADDEMFMALNYLSILRAMRDHDANAFYTAMSMFVDDEEFDNAMTWLGGEDD